MTTSNIFTKLKQENENKKILAEKNIVFYGKVASHIAKDCIEAKELVVEYNVDGKFVRDTHPIDTLQTAIDTGVVSSINVIPMMFFYADDNCKEVVKKLLFPAIGFPTKLRNPDNIAPELKKYYDDVEAEYAGDYINPANFDL